MGKIAVALVACMLGLIIMPVTAFAHGHSSRAAVNQRYSLCNVENCNAAGTHYHGDTCYYGHYIGDGHDYHQLCNVQGCALAGTHEHDGTTCFSHYNGDGHSYHNPSHHNGSSHH